MTISGKIAAWASGLRLADVPEDVRHIAKRCVIDTVGVIIAGGTTGLGRKALALAQDQYAVGICEVPGTAANLSPAGAALAGGTAAHALDFDDTSYTGIMHGSAVSLPAVLGVAQKCGRSGEDFLTDFIAAVEATYAIAMMCSTRQYYDGWWTSGTFGVPGAAAGAGLAYGLNVDQISQAIGIATVQASGMKAMFGTDTKPLLAGRAAALSVESAAAVQHGLTGPEVGFEEHRGYLNLINHGEADLNELERLGTTWRLKDPGILFKPFPICSAGHAGAEMAGQLAAENGLQPSEIASVVCHVPEVVEVSLVYDTPQTPQQAQFSMPFAVACVLINGTIAPGHISRETLEDPAVQAEMAKVSMRRDDALAANPAAPEGARVVIETTDGRSVSGVLEAPTGMPGNPLSDEQLGAKFLACCAFADAQEAWAKRLLETLWAVDDQPELAGVFMRS
ncbi:MAG: MmgE/PrpD family protein [Alphaproteobacteria bacterium]|nr:MmgE/PrpD family protein [Alphaproteobacteria bacterium]